MDGDSEQNILLEESILIDSNNEDKGRIIIFTINRPDKLNALNKSVSTAIKEASIKAMDDDSVRVVILVARLQINHQKAKEVNLILLLQEQIFQNSKEKSPKKFLKFFLTIVGKQYGKLKNQQLQ